MLQMSIKEAIVHKMVQEALKGNERSLFSLLRMVREVENAVPTEPPRPRPLFFITSGVEDRPDYKEFIAWKAAKMNAAAKVHQSPTDKSPGVIHL